MFIKSLLANTWRNKKRIFYLLYTLLIIPLTLFAILSYANRNFWKKSYTQIINQCHKYLFPTIDNKNVTKPDETFNWKLYVNKEYGFLIRYPDYLKPLAPKIDLYPEHQKYIEMCKSGELNGCGGGPWPDYLIAFLKQDQKVAFIIDIYGSPLKEILGTDSIENEGFTFLARKPFNYYKYRGKTIDIDPISDNDIKKITNTMTFFKPNKPLACLRTELSGFDPINDKKYIDENSDKLIDFTSFYFDQKNQECKTKMFYTWKDQINKASPFDSLSSCISACK